MPWVKSKNLASTILSMIARRLPTQWEERYGIRPVLLETFVDTERFAGTCYKAANWIYVVPERKVSFLKKHHTQSTIIFSDLA